jgi:hypothetical protein
MDQNSKIRDASYKDDYCVLKLFSFIKMDVILEWTRIGDRRPIARMSREEKEVTYKDKQT